MRPTNEHGPRRDDLAWVLEHTRAAAAAYLDGLDERPVRQGDVEAAARALCGPLPEDGAGVEATLSALFRHGQAAAIHSSGPRFFHLVVGGTTPAALGADWWASTLDQVGSAWLTSPLSVRVEAQAIHWLCEALALPSAWGGVLTSGAMMANYTCLAVAREWWGERHGVDVASAGLTGLPRAPIFSSGHLHASSIKALSMLGFGRDAARRFARDRFGRLDVDALEAALRDLDGAPAILIGNAGEVNGGDFDPLDVLADLSQRYGAWLHVDGAFGLFTRAVPGERGLTAGIEGAHSVTTDGHKWLNVPYDCGVAFLAEPEALARPFSMTAEYLPEPGALEGEEPVVSNFTPESSRRARSLPVWATLHAYGRRGLEAMVAGHLELTRHIGRRVEAHAELELLAPVRSNVCYFRYAPAGVPAEELDALNARLGARLLEDGRVFVGTTTHAGCVGLRPALVGWRIREQDCDLLVDLVLELGPQVVGG